MTRPQGLDDAPHRAELAQSVLMAYEPSELARIVVSVIASEGADERHAVLQEASPRFALFLLIFPVPHE